MADLLAQVGDLSEFIGESLAFGTEELLLELATAAVQAAAGQRIVEVEDDQVELLGTDDRWLPLPERPVQSVASVEIDGDPITDFDLRGSRLWRELYWSQRWRKPSSVSVAYTHGYPDGDQGMQFARQATLMIAAQMNVNPTGATGFSIDDYREQYSQASGAVGGELPESLRKALRRRYGAGVWTLAAV